MFRFLFYFNFIDHLCSLINCIKKKFLAAYTNIDHHEFLYCVELIIFYLSYYLKKKYTTVSIILYDSLIQFLNLFRISLIRYEI